MAPTPIPTLTTPRLLLRPLSLADVAAIVIQATHFGNNPPSGQVMKKLGMTYEGCRRQHTLKWGEYRDIKLYGVLREDWQPLSLL
jgi:hypothetical protein